MVHILATFGVFIIENFSRRISYVAAICRNDGAFRKATNKNCT